MSCLYCAVQFTSQKYVIFRCLFIKQMWRALCLGNHSLIVILAPASINICCLTCSITFELNGLYYKLWQSGQHWLGLEGIVNSSDSLYCYCKDWVMPRIFKPKLVESLPFSTTAVFSFFLYHFISSRPGFPIFSSFPQSIFDWDFTIEICAWTQTRHCDST